LSIKIATRLKLVSIAFNYDLALLLI